MFPANLISDHERLSFELEGVATRFIALMKGYNHEWIAPASDIKHQFFPASAALLVKSAFSLDVLPQITGDAQAKTESDARTSSKHTHSRLSVDTSEPAKLLLENAAHVFNLTRGVLDLNEYGAGGHGAPHQDTADVTLLLRSAAQGGTRIATVELPPEIDPLKNKQNMKRLAEEQKVKDIPVEPYDFLVFLGNKRLHQGMHSFDSTVPNDTDSVRTLAYAGYRYN